ncbi:MAG: hypothetical protein L6Q38_03340 [Nitrospira sp.]|nr:hypothetical protein [Nitrospira sp.]
MVPFLKPFKSVPPFEFANTTLFRDYDEARLEAEQQLRADRYGTIERIEIVQVEVTAAPISSGKRPHSLRFPDLERVIYPDPKAVR